MEKVINIAIDGPAGAGKSTIAKLLAEKLGVMYLDTGAMYRAVGLYAVNNGVNIEREEEVIKLFSSAKICVTHKDGKQYISVNDVDLTDAIRERSVSAIASRISALHFVREMLVSAQREMAKTNNLVLDGRDIGSFVLPKADYKFYLTASVAERARRRWLELTKKGDNCDIDSIEKDIASRDHADMTRDFAPLCKASDAIEVDTTAMTIDEVVETLLQIINSPKRV